MNVPFLSIALWLPVLSAVICFLIPRRHTKWAVYVTSACCLVEIALTGAGFYLLPTVKGLYEAHNFLWVERYPWFSMDLGGEIGRLQVDYLLGLDGLNGPLLLLAALLFFVGTLVSSRKKSYPPSFFALYLLLFGAVMGALCSLDMLPFLLFLELTAVPAYLLISFWGSTKRFEASLQLILYSFAGSLLIFLVMLGLYLSVILCTDEGATALCYRQLDLTRLINPAYYTSEGLLSLIEPKTLGNISLRSYAFFALLIGLLIKLPAVPLHTWLPKAHVEAPTAVSIVLAGVLLKLGGYALLRLGFGLFATEMSQYAPVIAFFGILSIIYAGLNALQQQDIKRLIAYASISHMGFVLLGISGGTIYGTLGAVYQMVSHGFITAALFMLVGCLEKYAGSRRISDISGLSSKMPHLGWFFLLFSLAAFGVPGFSSFVAEALVLTSLMQASVGERLSWALPALTMLGILLTAGYFAWTYQRVFQGLFFLHKKKADLKLMDITRLEKSIFLGLLAAILLLGLHPQLLMEAIYGTAAHLEQLLQSNLSK